MHRRFVTGVDPEGISIVVHDGPAPGRLPSSQWDELWTFDGLPAIFGDTGATPESPPYRLSPHQGTIACRLFSVCPKGHPDVGKIDAEWGESMDYSGTETLDDDSGPWMHRTRSVDVIVVISGAMNLHLDGGEIFPLGPGDSVIQHGTMHGWEAIVNEPCLAVAIMVSAGPGE